MASPGSQSGSPPVASGEASGLDAQLDALLAEMGTAPPAPATPSSDPVTPISAADAAEAAVASIEQQVESLVDQFVDASAPGEADATEPKDPAPIPSEDPAPMVRVPEVKAKSETPPPSPKPQAVPETIHALDEQLAKLTDDLLTTPVSAPPASAAPDPAPQPAPVSAAPAAQTSAAPESTPIQEPQAIETEVAAAPAEPTPKAVEPVSAPVKPSPQPSKFAAALAKPLHGKPRMIRDTVGWLGVNSLFLAGVVWTYHLCFQRPEPLKAEHTPVSLVASNAGHAGAGEHGEAQTEPAEHGAKEHQGHDEAPLTAAVPLQKKKPTYALSDAMAAKLAGKKGGEKDAKGGGGHGEAAKSEGHGGH